TGKVIKRLAIDLTPSRSAFRPLKAPPRFGDRADSSDGVHCQRFARQPRAARQLPVTLFRDERGAQLAHPALIEGQGSTDFEIEYFERRRVRPPIPGSRKRHLDYRSGREDWHSLHRMVGDPRQHLLVEMMYPTRCRAALAETENWVIVRRIYRIGCLGRRV